MRLSGALRIAAASAVALALAAAAIGTTLSHRAIDAADYQAAAAANPWSAEAKAGQAATFASQKDFQRAEELARLSIHRSPLNADAAAILGYAEEQRGNTAKAAELMGLAASMSWASETAQLWMLGQAAAAERFDETIARTDALLRQRLRREELFEYLRSLTAEPRALKPLARHLALRPRWRRDFLGELAGLSPKSVQGHGSLLAELKKTAAPPTDDEVNAFVARLVADRRYGEAKTAWLTFGDSARVADTLVNDGEFRRLRSTSGGSPFDWAVNSTPGLRLRADVPPAGGGRSALRIEAEGRPSARAIEQVVVLSPGKYSLTALAYGGRSESLESIRWELSCPGGSARPIVTPGALLALESGWTRMETLITIPPGCPGQRLALQVDHDRSGDLDVWLTGIKLRRLD